MPLVDVNIAIRPMVKVSIEDDRDTALAFMEWCLRPDVLILGDRHGGSGPDWCVGYYDVKHEPRIRAWFEERKANRRE